MLYDYHLHSQFSADSEMSLTEICETSINKGLTEIAITDHHDPDYKDPTIEFLLNKKAYLAEIRKLQQKYKGKLKIKKGIEIGLQLHILTECNNYLTDDFDFIIASFHTAEKADLYNGDFFRDYNQWEAYLNYLKTVLAVVKVYQNYNVIGHLDIIRRYGEFVSKPDLLTNKTAVELISEILKIIIQNDKGLEVNTSGYRIDQKNPLPSFSILKLYHELGGKILTIGSDSHKPEQIAHKFKFTISKLKEIGFTELTTFTNRQPNFHKI